MAYPGALIAERLSLSSPEESAGNTVPGKSANKGGGDRGRSRWRKGRRPKGTWPKKPRTGHRAGNACRLVWAKCVEKCVERYRLRYCDTAGKLGGNGEDKQQPIATSAFPRHDLR